MKPKSTLRSFLLLAGSSLLAISSAHAGNGSWNADAAGNWSDPTKWAGGTASDVANGADFTALFDDVITGNRIVTLDSSRSIGNVTAADTTHDFTIQSNTLTLDVTSGSPTISVPSGRTLTISSVVAGSDGFTKTGDGTATLSGANTIGGNVIVSAGAVDFDQSGNRTFDSLSGSGDFRRREENATLSILDASTFQGNLRTFAGGNSSHTIEFKSMGDAVGAGNLQTGGGTGDSNQRTTFRLYGDVGPLTLSNRDIEILPKNPTPSNWSSRATKLENNNATPANKWVINTDLINVTDRNHELELLGSNTGENEFAGDIGNSTAGSFYSTETGILSVIKAGAGKWILSGVNTYTGSTSITDGTLEIRGAGQLGGGNYAGTITSADTTPSPFTFGSSANQTLSGVINGTVALVKDGAGTLSITGSAIHTGGTTVTTGTLSLGDGTNNANLNDFSTLSVAGGAVLNLNYTGLDSVFFLNLGGSPAATGKWGRINSITELGADFESALITGDGLIENLNGLTTNINIAFWDGGSVDIVGDGDATGITNNGTWDTITQNWDFGATAHAAWPNTNSSKAYFRRAGTGAHTVTLGADITLGELDYRGTPNTADQLFFGDASEDNNLNFGGAKIITTNDYYVTFRSGITGAPTINYTARQNDNSSKLTLAPAGSLTMNLGAINTIVSPLNAKNCTLELGGSSTGNSASSVTWSNVAQQLALNKVGAGTWTLSGGWDNTPMGDSQWKVQGGTLILNGNFNVSHRIDVESGGTLGGNATLRVDRTGATEHVRVLDGGTLSPGTSVGTINVNDKTTIAGKLKIEVNGATADLLAITGDLDLSALTDVIEVVELGAATLADYTVVTYTGALTGTFNTATLPAGYTVDYSTPGQIHLLVVGGPSNPYSTWASTNATSGGPDDDFDGDGVSNAVEFVLGGLASTNDLNKLPALSTSGGNMLFTFKRDQDSIDASVSVEIEVGTDLATWGSSYTVGGTTGTSDAGVTVSKDDPGVGTDTVTLSVVQAPDTKKFARLKVAITP